MVAINHRLFTKHHECFETHNLVLICAKSNSGGAVLGSNSLQVGVYIPFLTDKVPLSYTLYDIKCHRFLTWPSLESFCIPSTLTAVNALSFKYEYHKTRTYSTSLPFLIPEAWKRSLLGLASPYGPLYVTLHRNLLKVKVRSRNAEVITDKS